MSSSIPDARSAVVLTISDSRSRGEREDLSGPAVAKFLGGRGFAVAGIEIIPDEKTDIERAIRHWSAQARLVVTTGGTGIGPRDVTPEATRAVCDRILEGVGERMRSEGSKRTAFAALSRGVCGVRGITLVLNLPGNPNGAVDSLATVIDLIPHALELLTGNTRHP
jgi:molybdopterin adenylyltransferase